MSRVLSDPDGRGSDASLSEVSKVGWSVQCLIDAASRETRPCKVSAGEEFLSFTIYQMDDDEFPKVEGGGSLILAWQIRNKRVLVVGGGEAIQSSMTKC
jgi:hypothetical protein